MAPSDPRWNEQFWNVNFTRNIFDDYFQSDVVSVADRGSFFEDGGALELGRDELEVDDDEAATPREVGAGFDETNSGSKTRINSI